METPPTARLKAFIAICALLLVIMAIRFVFPSDSQIRQVTDLRNTLATSSQSVSPTQPRNHPFDVRLLRAGSTTQPVVIVPILVYHNIRAIKPSDSADQRTYIIEPAVFEEQMRYLSENGYHTVSMDAIADALTKGTPLPDNPVVITFDDGREDQYTNAYPILEKYHQVATFYVFTNAMEREGYLTWEQMKEMVAHGMTMGSHTVFHPYLTKMTADEAKKEIEASKTTIESHLGTTVTSFAYPFDLHTTSTIELVQQAGYRTARTLGWGSERDAEHLYELKGRIVTNSLENLKKALSD